MHWKIYADEGLAKREVALWLGSEVLTVEYAGEPLARYDVEDFPRTKNLREAKQPQLFETSHRAHSLIADLVTEFVFTG
jgi:hypothetical protein